MVKHCYILITFSLKEWLSDHSVEHMSQRVVRIAFFEGASTHVCKESNIVSSTRNFSAGIWLKGLEAGREG